LINDEFKFDLAAYLAKEPNAPVKTLGEIIDRGLHHVQLDQTFRLRNAPEKRETEHYRQVMVKRRALRALVLATMEEQRIDALAYPTLRRKPTLIGEGQVGSTCQLSAHSGLPAISVPAGFTPDGLPIGLELLGGAYSEATLLKYAYAWEQATKPRRPPFSTPALIKGLAPGPVTFESTIAGASGASALVKLTYEPITGALRYDATTSGLTTADRVLALTLQRSISDKPGPIVAHILAPNQISGSGTLTMRGRDREDLVAGTLYLHFYTRQAPLGVARTKLVVP
jgi:amidase